MPDHPPSHFHSAPDQWDKLKPRARQMRHEPTTAEHVLWERLRNRGILGAKFRRQYAIDRFVVDFVCLENRLIVEVDGDIHAGCEEHDTVRQQFLESRGFRVLRFANGEVLRQTYQVLQAIAKSLAG